MDFTLALTHFCEVHGPKSVLCTQVLPLDCALCLPPSPPLRARDSSDTLATQINDSFDDSQASSHPSLERTGTMGTNSTLSTQFSAASTTVASEPDSPTIERHPYFKASNTSRDYNPQFRYGRVQGDTCASCAFTVPQKVARNLPAGAPGSLKADGKMKNGPPVLRSREFRCLGHNDQMRGTSSQPGHSSSQESNASSFQSFGSLQSHTDCHDHTLTYLTAKSPDDPESFSQLRASVIRTLSCEILPRGMSDGPLCFGDSTTGYTIAYVFRLTDPKARGRRRAYAFVALAGKDASRAFKACPMIWEAFATMASSIEQAAQRYQDEQQMKEEETRANGQHNYTPVSSFLTQRAVDPDGHPRRAGQPTPRGLADIVGDENIFAILHQYFVHVLRCLGDKFGGLPLTDQSSTYRSFADEDSPNKQTKTHLTVFDARDTRPVSTTPTQERPRDGVDGDKTGVNKKLHRNSQCGPLVTDNHAQRQIAV